VLSTRADQCIKWFGTVTTAAGVLLTSFDQVPLNKIVGIIGSVIWCWIGWRMREPSLYWLNAFFVVILTLGLVISLS
jgi:hypothetical protein